MTRRSSVTRGLFVAVLALCGFVVGCADDGPPWPETPGPKVIASFPPIYCFAANVAGDYAAVRPAMTTQGPHHFDPKPSDSRLARKADLYFVNGLGLDERAAARLKGGSGNAKLKLINLGEKIDPKQLEEGACHHDHGDGQPHEHGYDPHVWLGLDLATTMVAGIRDELKAADPSRAADYDRRASEYTAKLDKLRDDGIAMLKGKKERKFVSFHESLTYFARTFKLDVAEVIEVVPGKEPTGKQLEQIVTACIENKVRIIAVEPQYSGQAAAKRILEELKRKGINDAALIELDPLETANEGDLNPGWYEAKMRANLKALADVLK